MPAWTNVSHNTILHKLRSVIGVEFYFSVEDILSFIVLSLSWLLQTDGVWIPISIPGKFWKDFFFPIRDFNNDFVRTFQTISRALLATNVILVIVNPIGFCLAVVKDLRYSKGAIPPTCGTGNCQSLSSGATLHSWEYLVP